MRNKITAYISTKNRYDIHHHCLMSIAQQSLKPDKLIIFDDGEQKDLRDDFLYLNIFKILDLKGIKWEVLFGEGKGQVFNHQKMLEISETDWIWRIDDDEVADPNVLELLMRSTDKDVGAVAGLIINPNNIFTCSEDNLPTGKMDRLFTENNLQWYMFSGKEREVEHLHSSFLINRDAAIKAGGYPLNLSPVGHREETIFTHEIFRSGYKLIVQPSAITYHLRSEKGGIRSFRDERLWQHDEQIFSEKLKEWNLKEPLYIVLDNGMGDHYALKQILPEIQNKNKNRQIILATCYPEVFEDTGLHQISIQEAKERFNSDELYKFNIYGMMKDLNWKKSIIEAYRKMYLGE